MADGRLDWLNACLYENELTKMCPFSCKTRTGIYLLEQSPDCCLCYLGILSKTPVLGSIEPLTMTNGFDSFSYDEGRKGFKQCIKNTPQ